MPDSPSNGNGDKLRKLADNSVAILFARYFMPVALALIGWLMVRAITSVDTSIAEIKTEGETRSKATWAAVQLAAEKAQLALSNNNTINQQLSDHIARENEINDNLKAIEQDHEQRIRVIENRGR